MAAVTNLLWSNTDSIPQAIATGDTVTAPGDWTFTQNVSINGNLTVTGSITSGSTLNSVSQDAFLDLGFGYLLNTANQPGGFTLDTRRAAGFVPGNVTGFPSLLTFTYTDAGGSTLLAAGDVVMLTNLAGGAQVNEGYYIIQSVSGAAFPQTVTIYNTSQSGTPWANTSFTFSGAAVPPGNASKINLAVVAVADGTSQFNDADGIPWPVGTVLSAYVTNATLAQFQVNGVYNAIGGTSLQRAYDTGNSIVTDAGVPIAFTLTNGGFSVQGTGNVDVGTTTPIGTFSVIGSSTVQLNSSGGTINLGNLLSNAAINVGTVGSRIITLGQGIGTGPTIILNAIANTTTFEGFGSLAIGSNYSGGESITLGSIAGGALGYQRDVYIGSTSSTSQTNLYAGTGGVNINGLTNISSTTNAINLTSTTGSINLEGNTTGTINLGAAGGTGTISIGTALTARTINIGNTGTGAKTISIGDNTVAASVTTINGGTTGGVNIATAAVATPVNIQTGAADGALNIATNASLGRTIVIGNSIGTTSLSLQSGTNGLNIGTAVTNKAITIGQSANTGNLALIGGTGGITLTTSSTGTILIGSDTSTGNIDIASGVGATSARSVNVATGGTGAKTLTLGSTATTSTSTLQSGTGGIVISSQTTGTIQIGNDTGTGTIFIGSSTGARQIDIGNGATSTATVNIVGSAATGARTINIGIGGTGAKTIVIGSSSVAGTAVGIQAGTTLGVNIATDAVATPVNIATGTTAGTVSVGTGTASQTLNFGTGNAAKTVGVGSTSSSSATTVQAGTGNLTLSTAATTGNINVTNTANGALNLFNDTGTGTVNIVGSTATGARSINIGTGTSGIKTITIGAAGAVFPATSYPLVGSYTYLNQHTIFGSSSVMSSGGIRVFNFSGGVMAPGTVVITLTGTGANGGRPFVTLAAAGTANVKGFTGVIIESLANSTEGNAAAVAGTIAWVNIVSAPLGSQVNNPVYLSLTAGQATMTPPSASGQRVFLIGYLLGSSPDPNGNYPVQLYPQFIADIP